MDQPLTEWYCDVCGEKITNVKDGYVTWKSTAAHKAHDFIIIHQGKCDDQRNPSSNALEDFVGVAGLTYLLSMLSLGTVMHTQGQAPHCRVADTDEFVDFVRRVQTPYYEEARRKFSSHRLLNHYAGANEVAPYQEQDLKYIIQTF